MAFGHGTGLKQEEMAKEGGLWCNHGIIDAKGAKERFSGGIVLDHCIRQLVNGPKILELI